MTNSEIDRLGQRLKIGPLDEGVIRDLNRFYDCFGPTVETVFKSLDEIGVQSSKRIGKSRPSIVAKLERETMRLSQMQDIVGCRIIVNDLLEQESMVQQIAHAFSSPNVQDKTKKAIHGYRAVHIIVKEPRPFEIQVRTQLQHEFAELVEAVSTRQNSALKYGGGPSNHYEAILFVGAVFQETEDVERLRRTSPMPRELLKEIMKRENRLVQVRRRLPEAIMAVMKGAA